MSRLLGQDRGKGDLPGDLAADVDWVPHTVHDVASPLSQSSSAATEQVGGGGETLRKGWKCTCCSLAAASMDVDDSCFVTAALAAIFFGVRVRRPCNLSTYGEDEQHATEREWIGFALPQIIGGVRGGLFTPSRPPLTCSLGTAGTPGPAIANPMT